jgi:hypothetical protein
VIGNEQSLKEWALGRGGSGRRVRLETASGILIGALGTLAQHFRRLSGGQDRQQISIARVYVGYSVALLRCYTLSKRSLQRVTAAEPPSRPLCAGWRANPVWVLRNVQEIGLALGNPTTFWTTFPRIPGASRYTHLERHYVEFPARIAGDAGRYRGESGRIGERDATPTTPRPQASLPAYSALSMNSLSARDSAVSQISLLRPTDCRAPGIEVG